MALDSLEKRHGVMGLALPWMMAALPIATPDQQWRMSVGNVYGGNALSPAAASAVPVFVHHYTKNIGSR